MWLLKSIVNTPSTHAPTRTPYQRFTFNIIITFGPSNPHLCYCSPPTAYTRTHSHSRSLSLSLSPSLSYTHYTKCFVIYSLALLYSVTAQPPPAIEPGVARTGRDTCAAVRLPVKICIFGERARAAVSAVVAKGAHAIVGVVAAIVARSVAVVRVAVIGAAQEGRWRPPSYSMHCSCSTARNLSGLGYRPNCWGRCSRHTGM